MITSIIHVASVIIYVDLAENNFAINSVLTTVRNKQHATSY